MSDLFMISHTSAYKAALFSTERQFRSLCFFRDKEGCLPLVPLSNLTEGTTRFSLVCCSNAQITLAFGETESVSCFHVYICLFNPGLDVS